MINALKLTIGALIVYLVGVFPLVATDAIMTQSDLIANWQKYENAQIKDENTYAIVPPLELSGVTLRVIKITKSGLTILSNYDGIGALNYLIVKPNVPVVQIESAKSVEELFKLFFSEEHYGKAIDIASPTLKERMQTRSSGVGYVLRFISLHNNDVMSICLDGSVIKKNEISPSLTSIRKDRISQ